MSKRAKSPNLESATATARVLSRLLRKAGFPMAVKHSDYYWTEGFHVFRVGCSRAVSVGYHIRSSDWRTPEAESRRRELSAKLDAWLAEHGYPREKHTGYIVCKRPG